MRTIAKIAFCTYLFTFVFSGFVEAKKSKPQTDLKAEQEIQFDELLRQLDDTKLFDRTRSTALRQDAVIHPEDRDPADIVLRRAAALLKNVRLLDGAPSFALETKQLEALQDQAASISPEEKEKRAELYRQACLLRRRVTLANPLLDFDKILFIKREINDWREDYGNHMCDQFFGFHATPGGGVFVLEGAFGDSPTLTDLTATALCQDGRFKGRALQGGFLSPELSFDGKTILFAFTEAKNDRYKWTEETTYHIFKMNADGTNLRQLTDGPVNDFDPCFLPNGRVAFISERRGGFGRCHGRPVPSFTLHSMYADGDDITILSPHETNEWFPSVDNNGMIVYTRWDYVDRGHGQAHHPWLTTPDGRDSRAIQGNYAAQNADRPNQEMSVRAIPNSRKYVATATGHHAQFYGSFVIVDPAIIDDDKMAMVHRLTPEALFPESEYGTHSGEGKFATAWPLSEDYYLCVYDPRGNDGTRQTKREDVKYGIYLIDSFGNRELLYRDPGFSCLEPIPFHPRQTPPIIPHLTLVGLPPQNGEKPSPTPKEDLPKTGTVGLMNVYNTKLPFPEGTKITALRIIQILPKTTPRANEPRIGYGDQKSARAILGVVPVEEDGSAYFEMPVKIPVYFQALNEEGLAVQSMRSATWVAPGETLTCNGCHEPRGSVPTTMNARPTAFLRPPSKIMPDVDGSKPFSFPRLVQPVLEKNCVPCHTRSIAEGKEKTPDLRKNGDEPTRKDDPHWFTSYANLRDYAHFWDNASYTLPRTTPGKFGGMTSKLYAMLRKGHHEVELTDEEMHRLTLWLDSNSDFYGSYHDTAEQAAGKIILPDLE